jgi:hypothetical protein
MNKMILTGKWKSAWKHWDTNDDVFPNLISWDADMLG